MVVAFTLFIAFVLLCIISLIRTTYAEFGNDCDNYWKNLFTFLRVFLDFMNGTTTNRIEKYKAIGKAFPRYVLVRILSTNNLFLHDPEILKKIYTAQNACARPSVHIFQTPYSLLAAKYDYWKKARKELNPAFSSNVLKNFIPVFYSESSKIVEKIKKNYPNGKEFDLQEHVEEMIFNTLAITVFDLRGKLDIAKEMKPPIFELMQMQNDRLFTFWMHNPTLFKMSKESEPYERIKQYLMDFTSDTLDESIKRREKSFDENANVDDILMRPKVEFFIDILLRNKNFSRQEIMEHLGFFVVAGADTTTTMMTTTMLFLAMHPEYQDKVYEEIRDNINDESTELTLDILNRLTYLEQCINEALRLFPPVAHTPRLIIREPLEVGLKKPLRKGTQIQVMHYLMHHRADIWGEDHEEYKPDRFSPEEVEKRHPYAFIPFGMGPKMCIGWKYAIMSAKADISTILRAFKLKTRMTMKDMIPNTCISTRLLNPPMVSVELRNN